MNVPRLSTLILTALTMMSHPLAASVASSPFGKMPDGRPMTCYTLTNAHGLRVRVLDYGAILASVETPDRNGKFADVTLGYDSAEGWLGGTSYFGATVGRYANRIAGGKFTLDGRTYALGLNNSPGGIPCHLHGGAVGFNKMLWAGRILEGSNGVEFLLTSGDGDQGYPGTLKAKVTYALTGNDELRIDYEATTDKPTVVNLTNHAYWNLTGDMHRKILGHRVEIEAGEMLPVNAGLIPTGKLEPVAGSPFDFSRERVVGDVIGAADLQLRLGNGFDHCWVLRGGPGLRLAARVSDPESGRMMELFSDQPGLQFYTGNFLDGSAKGKGGVAYQFRTGLCFEPEKFPDSPNQPQFQSPVLRPGEVYRHAILWRFSTLPK